MVTRKVYAAPGLVDFGSLARMTLNEGKGPGAADNNAQAFGKLNAAFDLAGRLPQSIYEENPQSWTLEPDS